jgi:delta-lactam-biosynthetic de-N-acetylase
MINRRNLRHKNSNNPIIVLSVVVIASAAFLGGYYFFNSTNENTEEIIQINDGVVAKPAESEAIPKEIEDTTSTNNPIEKLPTDAEKKIYTYGNFTVIESDAKTDRIGFWFGRNKTFTRPNGPISIDIFNKYNSYYIGANEKVIYLTFDEGLNNTQANKNLDTLKKHNIKGTFFLTKGFIESNVTLVNRMVNEGHIVGNHTMNHLDMSTVASEDPEKFIKELAMTEEAFTKVTGKDLNKVFRFPEGTFSEKALDYVNQMGYRSIFWSFAYKDWNADWNSKEQSLEWMKNYYHPGAIYLLHGVNTGNSEALDEFISFVEEQGYKFDVVTNL